jgi:hypothetical protein
LGMGMLLPSCTQLPGGVVSVLTEHFIALPARSIIIGNYNNTNAWIIYIFRQAHNIAIFNITSY